MASHRLAVASTFVSVAVVLSACAGDDSTPQASPGSEASADASATAADEAQLVGEWERTNRCPELETALVDAGVAPDIAAEMIWGAFFWPHVETFEEFRYDEGDPCRGAEPLKHSHFFTADGAFGSRDHKGEQVDEGTYEVTDEGTLLINGAAEFEYEVSGDSISFDPVVPADCSTEECLYGVAFSIAFAYPGQTWERASGP